MAPGIADKKNNTLPLWGNEKTMNLNNLILTNILSSHYFKVNLYQLKTYHEVIDEIYYQVTHLEPWEKGSRKTAGQTGMCGGVRGVGAGGIVSTAFCILYKLFTLKLTRKQLVGLINHGDSPYIRALGFMYIRYTQPPADLWDWYEPYLEDEEEIDVKAGSGQIMTIGEMLRHYLSKLEWFSTLFPRIPVPIQKDLERKLTDWRAKTKIKVKEDTDFGEVEQPSAAEGNWEEEEEGGNVREGSRHKESSRVDYNDEISRERERQRRDRDKHRSSKHHHSDHHKSHRSRSPSEFKPHREDSGHHRSKHRESDRPMEHGKHREVSSHRRDNDVEHEKSFRDKKHSHEKRESKHRSHSHSHDKKSHRRSRSREHY
ncbi:pre-mRNA-splicing factor 38B-like [Uloborus diversus]|uniref:pre-mRNA-splicing factor 38B-like n=1 Tax=Uloborus diversus TaxID=327109 RepID=UPI0024090C57|nr:pre-mRNA-splicing factor 38B-like [Uloborus diversus]